MDEHSQVIGFARIVSGSRGAPLHLFESMVRLLDKGIYALKVNRQHPDDHTGPALF
jgi:hypothetical protein